MRSKIILILLLSTVALGAAGFWFWQRNPFSTGSLKLEIVVSEEVTMGEEITYIVQWKNNGEAELEDAKLIFEYPESTLVPENGSLRITRTLNDINPGQEQSVRFTGRLFGKEGDQKEAKATITYSPRNLSASFQSDTKATTEISLVPLNFELDIPSRMESGQQFDITLNYFSNSSYPLSDLRLHIEYPDAFEFERAFPPPIGDNEWDIGLLNRGDGGRISISGSLEGDVQEVKQFRAILGSWKDGEFTLMKEVNKGVQISKPRLFISQVVNSSPEYIASLGDTLHYEIFFKNPTDRVLENLFLVVTFDGRGFDLGSIKVDRGKFQKGDNSIIWEARDISKLRFLGTGEEGKVEFWINVKEEVETFSSQDKNLKLKNQVLISEAKEEFEVKLNAGLVIDQRAFFQDEVFGNNGPIPPRAGSRTTYTIIWEAKNQFNDVQNGRVKGVLPQGVELTGRILPEDAILTFDPISREVVWEVGDLPVGTGFFEETPAASVSFQIGFTPNLSQRGNPAELIGEARITGEDLFTEQAISSIDEAINTTLPDDPTVTEEQGKVQ